MTDEADRIDVLDVVRLVNDPQLPVQSTAGVSRINRMVTTFLHELQGMGTEAATDYVVHLCREVDADFDGMQATLSHKLRVLDVIQDLRSAEDVDQARMLAVLKLQMDRIEAKMDVTAAAAVKAIDPTGYYSYDEAAEAVGVSVSTLRREAKRNKLRTINIGRLVKIVGGDLLTYQAERDGGVRVLGD
jgi:excisionase family DNA binding protein